MMDFFIVIVFVLVLIIISLIVFSVYQIKMAGMNVYDFWSFIKANDTLDKLYAFSEKYDKLTPQQQIIFLREAESIFNAFEKVPDALWEDDFQKYDEILNKYKDIKMLRWEEGSYNNKAITLIVLIITIIILLILSGVTLSLVFGDDGIIGRSITTKNINDSQEKTEKIKLAIASAEIDGFGNVDENALKHELNENFGADGYEIKENITDGWTLKIENDEYSITEDGEINDNKIQSILNSQGRILNSVFSTVVEDEAGDTVVVPPGFKITLDESIVKKGVVIEDTRNGNQFVWIEVPKEIFENVTSNTDYSNIEKDLINYSNTYRQSGYADMYYEYCGINQQNYEQQYNKMLESIYKNGGFWLGRYETGTTEIRTPDSSTAYDATLSDIPYIKKGLYPYNHVSVYQASKLADSLSTKRVKSTLTYGIQWDLACTFIENNSNLSATDITTDSGSWGNHYDVAFSTNSGFYMSYINDRTTGTWETTQGYEKQSKEKKLFSTGITERNSILNIYDFAGNLFEWTLETNGSNTLTRRAGGLNDSGKTSPAARHFSYPLSSYNRVNVGFRIALYF